MKEDLKTLATKISEKNFKRKFNFLELYSALIFTPRAIMKLIKNNKNNLIGKDFIERLQLAVTEVNGCPACSYQHTKMALRQGMSNEEISSFLSGGNQFIKVEEARAIMFVQHFAESRGFPKRYSYELIVEEYGEKRASIILSAAQVMIAGNIYGIPYSAFQSRMKGLKYQDSSLLYELGMLLGGIIVLPIAIIHSLCQALIGLDNKKFDNTVIN